MIRERTTIRAMAYGGGEESESLLVCPSVTFPVGSESTKKMIIKLCNYLFTAKSTNKWSHCLVTTNTVDIPEMLTVTATAVVVVEVVI